MANLGASVDASVSAGGGGLGDLFNLSTPAGWAMLWWGLAAFIILATLISL